MRSRGMRLCLSSCQDRLDHLGCLELKGDRPGVVLSKCLEFLVLLGGGAVVTLAAVSPVRCLLLHKAFVRNQHTGAYQYQEHSDVKDVD